MDYFDLQVNGSAGVDFHEPGLRACDIQRVSDYLGSAGVRRYLATIVTAPRQTYHQILPIFAEAIHSSDDCLCRLSGIHLEGPFISDQDGAVGAHPKSCVSPCDTRFLDDLIEWSEDTIRLITIAPEKPNAPELIAHAVERGIAVSVGHTLANGAQVSAAVRAGARLATHLGNGIPQSVPRQNNPIVAIMAQPLLTPMMITDGHHLSDDFIRMLVLAKGPNHLIITSDAAPVAGMPPGDYVCFGTPARLEPNGYLRNLAAPGLAGSASHLLQCLEHLKSVLKTLPDYDDEKIDAFINRTAIVNPWQVMHLGQPMSDPFEWFQLPDNECLIAFGANLGSPDSTYQQCQKRLAELPETEILACSTLITTDPVGGPKDQPPYRNGAIRLRTALDPRTMLRNLQRIEAELGRIRTVINGPRTCDLDILVHGRQRIISADLTLPHPRMMERLFVQIPVLEVLDSANGARPSQSRRC